MYQLQGLVLCYFEYLASYLCAHCIVGTVFRRQVKILWMLPPETIIPNFLGK